jgi:hypothetical protein
MPKLLTMLDFDLTEYQLITLRQGRLALFVKLQPCVTDNQQYRCQNLPGIAFSALASHSKKLPKEGYNSLLARIIPAHTENRQLKFHC